MVVTLLIRSCPSVEVGTFQLSHIEELWAMAVSALSRHASLLRPHSCRFVKEADAGAGRHAGAGPVRTFWAWLNSITNQVDKDRIKQVGPDRACAEWLLRCGAAVKWKDKNHWEKDYNSLPPSGFENYKVMEIDATSSSVMSIGFEHLRGLKHVQRIILHDCRYLYNDALPYLSHVNKTLVFLQLSNCGDISAAGLESLKDLKNLKRLQMFALPEVRDQQKALDMLRSALPKCDVTFTETRDSEENKSE